MERKVIFIDRGGLARAPIAARIMTQELFIDRGGALITPIAARIMAQELKNPYVKVYSRGLDAIAGQHVKEDAEWALDYLGYVHPEITSAEAIERGLLISAKPEKGLLENLVEGDIVFCFERAHLQKVIEANTKIKADIYLFGDTEVSDPDGIVRTTRLGEFTRDLPLAARLFLYNLINIYPRQDREARRELYKGIALQIQTYVRGAIERMNRERRIPPQQLELPLIYANR